MIKLENVTFKYDKIILNDINLIIDKNKVTFIIGINGSGKTTLGNIISGLIIPKVGNVYLDDIKITKKINNKVIRKKVGMIFQNPNNQILFTKVYDDIKFTLENMKYPKEDIPNIIENSLKKVNMFDYIYSNPYKLSGGQKQRIVIASQISYNPECLIFDEATSMIDINGRKEIYKLLRKLKKDREIIYITNDLSELIYADDIVIIDNCKIYKYTLLDIVKDNNILTNHNLDIPFILKIGNLLNIKNVNEDIILEKIKKIV